MYIGTRGYYTLSLIENEIDVWAILFPLSKLVNYSICLLENNNQWLPLAIDLVQVSLSKANIHGIKRRYNLIVILQL
jgi:hypothetical protein